MPKPTPYTKLFDAQGRLADATELITDALEFTNITLTLPKALNALREAHKLTQDAWHLLAYCKEHLIPKSPQSKGD